MVGWSNPGRGEIFRTCPDRPCGPPSFLYNGYRVFSGGKERSGRDADPSPPSSAVGHERVEQYFYSPYGAVQPVQSLRTCTRGAVYLFLKVTTRVQSVLAGCYGYNLANSPTNRNKHQLAFPHLHYKPWFRNAYHGPRIPRFPRNTVWIFNLITNFMHLFN